MQREVVPECRCSDAKCSFPVELGVESWDLKKKLGL